MPPVVPTANPWGTGKAGVLVLPGARSSPNLSTSGNRPPIHLAAQAQSWESSWCCHVLFPTTSGPTLAMLLSAQGPAWKDHINALVHSQGAMGRRSQEMEGGGEVSELLSRLPLHGGKPESDLA